MTVGDASQQSLHRSLPEGDRWAHLDSPLESERCHGIVRCRFQHSSVQGMRTCPQRLAVLMRAVRQSEQGILRSMQQLRRWKQMDATADRAGGNQAFVHMLIYAGNYVPAQGIMIQCGRHKCVVLLNDEREAHPCCQVMLTVLQIGIASHQGEDSTSRSLAALPQSHQHAAGVHSKLMLGHCCLKLRPEPVMAEPLDSWDKAQQTAVAG